MVTGAGACVRARHDGGFLSFGVVWLYSPWRFGLLGFTAAVPAYATVERGRGGFVDTYNQVGFYGDNVTALALACEQGAADFAVWGAGLYSRCPDDVCRVGHAGVEASICRIVEGGASCVDLFASTCRILC